MSSGCEPKVSEVPPEITAQCQDRGVVFSVAGSSEAQSLWEVGVDQEPLTRELAVQRGYLLSVQNQKTLLEIPLFSIGYMYEVRRCGQPWWSFNDAGPGVGRGLWCHHSALNTHWCLPGH